MTAKPRWSIWKKLFVLPFFLAIIVELLLIWVVISETVSEPRMIDGRPDDAPRMAAGILMFLVAVLYLGYATLMALIYVIVTPAESDSRS